MFSRGDVLFPQGDHVLHVQAEPGICLIDSTKSFFSLERPKEELESWSPGIVNVVEKDYADGYLKGGYRKTSFFRATSLEAGRWAYSEAIRSA